MARLTKAGPGGYVVPAQAVRCGPGVAGGEAIERLAAFENLADEIEAQQAEIAADLSRLRSAGRERSVQFKELLGKKLINAQILALLQARGLLG